MAITTYGDISPRTAAFAVAQMLSRGLPYLCIEKFGQTYPLPNNSTTQAKFRRYNSLPLATTPLVEGVTPAGSPLTVTDYTVALSQYGDFVGLTDVVQDTHEDPVLQQATEVLGEQAAQTIETVRYNVLKAGTNVFYANGTLRTDVNTVLTTTLQRKATRALKRQNARFITSVLKSTPAYATQPIEAAFIGLTHPDVENDIRGMSGFIPTKNYGTVTPFENEIGAVEDVRYLRSTIFTPFADGGGAKGSMLSTTGTNADVYPVLLIAKDAYGIVPLKGQNSLVPMIVNPKAAPGDPLGQRGTAGWKTMQGAIILNDAWMVRMEVAATA